MVFDEKGGYTQNSIDLSNEVHSLLKELIVKSMNEKGMTIEEVVYVASSEIESICLMNQIQQRKKKREQANESNDKSTDGRTD
jgi:pyocin large subunit-like protein